MIGEWKCVVCGEMQEPGWPSASVNGGPSVCYECPWRLTEGLVRSNFQNVIHINNLLYLAKLPPKRRREQIPKSLVAAVLRRYAFTCQHCGDKENLTIDHIKPYSKGGLTEFGNLQVLCRSCNSRKGAKTERGVRNVEALGRVDKPK